ncbi:MAG TPA: mannonate dehydratase [Candidatus Dormibacteraeota bacterium]|nr:mannonate dehydratase [Candidatus Dormibacteraeota bacterium]
MKETWRWFGPRDPISLSQVKQAGATGIVTALHDIYRGEAWPLEEVLKRKAEIEAAGLVWSVVESIPVHNSIKLRSGNFRQFIDAWKDSLATVAQAGVHIVCYNFMPVVDWTRTNLKWCLPSTGYALRFDATDFAAYDVFILQRKNAEVQYHPSQIAAARARFDAMPEYRRVDLEQTIIAGLPGAEVSYERETLRRQLSEYEGVTPADLRANLLAFLREVVPIAEDSGVRLGIHADDPPWSLFGLPCVVSTAEDVRQIFNALDTPANGLTFCVGSFGARADNDLLAMIREFAPRVHFAHLRQVSREADGSFYEAEHLNGSSDMIGAVRALLEEETARRRVARADHEIPMRPDHGHLLADDIHKNVNPGYSLVGRLKGLAELRGVVQGLRYAIPELR